MGLNIDDGQLVSKLTEMAESLAGINATLKSVEGRIDAIDKRVQAIEQRPSQILGYAISAIVSAAVALLFTLL